MMAVLQIARKLIYYTVVILSQLHVNCAHLYNFVNLKRQHHISAKFPPF